MRVCRVLMARTVAIHAVGGNFLLTPKFSMCILVLVENLEKLGKRLARERRRQGLSQGALARRAGVGQSTVSRVETGGPLTVAALGALARALGFDLRFVLVRRREGAPS